MNVGEIRTNWDELAMAELFGGWVIRNIRSHGEWLTLACVLVYKTVGGRTLRDTKVTDGSGSVSAHHSVVEQLGAIARLSP